MDLFFIRPLLPSTEDVTFLTHRRRHIELDKITRQRNRSQIKEKNKILTRNVSETDINNIFDKEFEVMTLKILTGFKKRVEYLREIKRNIQR